MNTSTPTGKEAMQAAIALEAQGFIIDRHCYPWLAYKGPRFKPDEWQHCLTDSEAAQRELIGELVGALESVHTLAKTMRKSASLVGPKEYENDLKAMHVWRKALYSAGKALFEGTRDVLLKAKGGE